MESRWKLKFLSSLPSLRVTKPSLIIQYKEVLLFTSNVLKRKHIYFAIARNVTLAGGWRLDFLQHFENLDVAPEGSEIKTTSIGMGDKHLIKR